MSAKKQRFIDKYKDDIISACSGTGLFPSVMMAQALLESGFGESLLASKYNNFFGIKANSGWRGEKIWLKNGKGDPEAYSYYRVYANYQEGFKDRVRFFQENQRYTTHGVFLAQSPQAQIQAMKNAGYAQDSNYVAKIMAEINYYNLSSLDIAATTTPVVITAPTPVVLPPKKKFPVVPVAIGGVLLVGTAIGLYYYNRKLRNRDGGFEMSLGYVPPIQFPMWAKVTLALGVFTVGAAVVAYAAKKPKDTALPPNGNPNTTNSTIMGTFKGSEYINKLHPSIRQKAAELAQALKDAGIPIFINHDGHYRTFAEQDALYAKGRTVKPPYKTVTNAKGGYSNHNYGLAVDMVPVDGKWNAPDSVYKKMGKVAKSLGWEWGGDFKSLYDPCHFQIFFGYTVSQLRKKHQNGEVDSNGYVLLT